MADVGDIDVDHVIEQLLSVRGARPGRQVNLTENEIRFLCVKSREIFIQQPVLLELEAPIKICGKYLSSPLTVEPSLTAARLEQVIYMGNTMTCCAYSNMVAFLLLPITCF